MISVWSNYGVANYSSYLFHLLLWREWAAWKPINRVNCPLGESCLFPLIKKAAEVFNSECKWLVEKSKAQWNLSHRDCTHFYVQCLVLQLKLPDHPADLTIHNLHKANKQEKFFWALWMCNTESNIAFPSLSCAFRCRVFKGVSWHVFVKYSEHGTCQGPSGRSVLKLSRTYLFFEAQTHFSNPELPNTLALQESGFNSQGCHHNLGLSL